MPAQLTNHVVAFLDILGFSEMVKVDCESADPPTFLARLYSAHQKAPEILGEDLGATLIQFSDSIVFSRPFELGTLKDFIQRTGAWQQTLLLSGLLCRGGIAFGRHFSDGKFLFSKGLIDAYLLETKTAKYPRVVLSDDLLQLIDGKPEVSALPVVHEEDGTTFVDYLAYKFPDERRALENVVSKLCAIEHEPSAVQEKLRWLSHYADFRLKMSLGPSRFVMKGA